MRTSMPCWPQRRRGLPPCITTFVLTHTESAISGDTAYDVGTYTQRLSTPDGMLDDMGNYIVMLKHTGGDWKIAYAIHNSDRP